MFVLQIMKNQIEIIKHYKKNISKLFLYFIYVAGNLVYLFLASISFTIPYTINLMVLSLSSIDGKILLNLFILYQTILVYFINIYFF